MRVALDLFGHEVLAVTIGLAGEAPDDDEDFVPDSPDYELTSDSMPVERAEWLDDDEDAPRPLVIVRGDHKRPTRVRRNKPPFTGSNLTRVDVRNGVKPSTPRGFGFQI